MNILRFITLKQDVACLYSDYTLRQALEKMEYHKYSAIPIIDREGRYVGTITEGDLLWEIKNHNSKPFIGENGIDSVVKVYRNTFFHNPKIFQALRKLKILF